MILKKICGIKACFVYLIYLIQSVSDDYREFLKKKNVQSLLTKAIDNNFPIHLKFDSNLLITDGPSHSYEAAIAVEFLKDRLLAQGELFTFETVMSHHSKLDFIKTAHQLGYKIYLYFISTTDVEINIERVKQRVIKKGHHVPEKHIRSRYAKSMELLSKMIPICYRTYLFDNSSETKSFVQIAEIYRGKELITHTQVIPRWIYTYVINPLNLE